jgi:AraC-like DNA-binding protein
VSSAPTNGTPAVQAPPTVLALARRERARGLLRAAFPRRQVRLVSTRAPADFAAAFRATLVDAALVDLSGATEETWKVAALAREYPSIPFFGVVSQRATDAPALAQCASLDFADVLVDVVDDPVARELVLRQTFSTRFASALSDPPPQLSLSTELQKSVWRVIVAHAGRPVQTLTLARALHVTREHLSRTFAAAGAPNLKRVIDLVRLLAAAELAKNPGYDLRDVARVLDFASASHLSATAQRVVGTKPASLARLRTVDLIERFVRGHGRSRA